VGKAKQGETGKRRGDPLGGGRSEGRGRPSRPVRVGERKTYLAGSSWQ